MSRAFLLAAYGMLLMNSPKQEADHAPTINERMTALGIAIALVLLVHITLAANPDSAGFLIAQGRDIKQIDGTVTMSYQPITDLAQLHIATIQADSCMEEVIRLLAESGQICNIFGHNWRSGRPGEGEIKPGVWFSYLDWHPGIEYRTCKICGKCESKTEEWK